MAENTERKVVIAMTMEETGGPLTDAEVAELARKLGEWGKRLSPEEQMFLLSIVARAASTAPDDVEGYAMDMLLQSEALCGTRPAGGTPAWG